MARKYGRKKIGMLKAIQKWKFIWGSLETIKNLSKSTILSKRKGPFSFRAVYTAYVLRMRYLVYQGLNVLTLFSEVRLK